VLYVFAGWTLFVWATRIENIVRDDGSAAALLIAIGMTALGAAVAVTLLLRRPRMVATTVLALAGATVAVWAVRAPMILADGDHGAAFKIVHTALAVVSVGLAVVALRRVRRVRRVASAEPAVSASAGG